MSSFFHPRSLSVLLLGKLLALSCMLSPHAAQAAVPNDDAARAYAEEQTILQTERETPEPGWDSAASGRRHFDRHFIIPPGANTRKPDARSSVFPAGTAPFTGRPRSASWCWPSAD